MEEVDLKDKEDPRLARVRRRDISYLAADYLDIKDESERMRSFLSLAPGRLVDYWEWRDGA